MKKIKKQYVEFPIQEYRDILKDLGFKYSSKEKIHFLLFKQLLIACGDIDPSYTGNMHINALDYIDVYLKIENSRDDYASLVTLVRTITVDLESKNCINDCKEEFKKLILSINEETYEKFIKFGYEKKQNLQSDLKLSNLLTL